MDKSSEELKTQDDTKTYFMSLIQKAVALGMKSQASLTSTMNARAPNLNSILKRAMNSKTCLSPAATESLERRGTLTSVSAREPVPQPDASYADQNWDLGGDRIFIRDNHLYGANVASINGVGDGPGEESRTDLDSHANMPVVGSGAHVLVDHTELVESAHIPQTTNLCRFHWSMLQCDMTVMGECTFC
jgi:hypothetical protein